MKMPGFRRRPNITPDQQERVRQMLKAAESGMMPPKQAEALKEWAGLYGTGRFGDASELLLKRTRMAQSLGRTRGELGTIVDYAKEMGPWGVLPHFFVKMVSSATGKYHVFRKRKDVVKAIQVFSVARPDRFRTLVFATTRFLYDNWRNKGTPIYDKLAEDEIRMIFGDMAMNNKSFSSMFPKSSKQSLADYGRYYLRHLIREEMLGNFGFLMARYRDEEKMAALQYGLVGDRINIRTEKRDLDRLQFVTEIFEHEVPEISRFLRSSDKNMKNRAMQALIRLRYKARQMIAEPGERAKFYFQVCEYFAIDPKSVDEYARNFYLNPRTKFGAPDKNLSAWQMTEQNMKTAIEREKEASLREQIQELYPELREKKRRRTRQNSGTAQQQQPQFIIPPQGLRFRPSRTRRFRPSEQ